MARSLRQWRLGRRAAARFALALGSAFCLPAVAHHSGALFYNVDASITITGTVEEFRFHNPHAIVILNVETDDGEVQRWTAETTSPSVLRRRGWSQASMKPGDTVTLTGIPALDGSLLMRITRAVRADGTEIGVPRGIDN
jgi:Family of unknown function (DUF6152)